MSGRATWKKFTHGIAAVLILTFGAFVLSFAMSSNNAANRDLISYWAAGRQLLHHANPYDGPAILALERGAGFADDRPFFMRNPPTAFILAAPLGLLREKNAAVLWSLLLIAMLMTSIRLLWIMEGRPPDRMHLVGYLFPPALACLLSGQIGIALLFSVTVFLYLHRSRPFLAGAALLLCTMKPHLFLPAAAVLVLWGWNHKRVLAGAGCACIFSLLAASSLDPSGWMHYLQMMRSAELQDEFIPTLSLFFRLIIHKDSSWLQLLPCIAVTAWAVLRFKKKPSFDWKEDGQLLLLVSVLSAPYAWFTDEAVVLPAVLFTLYRTSQRAIMLYIAISSIALLEVLFGLRLNSGFFLWTAPGWLAWYLFSNRQYQTRKAKLPPPPPEGAAMTIANP